MKNVDWKDEYENLAKFTTDLENSIEELKAENKKLTKMAHHALQLKAKMDELEREERELNLIEITKGDMK